MSNYDEIDAKFDEIDTNKDGVIQRNELRQWISNDDGVHTVPYESTIRDDTYFYDNPTSGFRRHYTTPYRTLYDDTALTHNLRNSRVIHTNSLEEANQYIERSASHVYKDPNPQIIRRRASGDLLTSEQRILVRYLEPPDVPEPGPLIVKEVRPPQQPEPLPLVIQIHPQSRPSSPPLTLRERPPTPPPVIPSETVTRELPAIPAPPASVIIEQFPPDQRKPRDILIERWIPYGPQPERRTIVQRAPSPIRYSEPYNKIIVYEGAETRVVRKVKKLGPFKANPRDYELRYGGTLLDSATLVQQARNVGIHDDISPPPLSSSLYRTIGRSTPDLGLSSETIDRDFLSWDTGYYDSGYRSPHYGSRRGVTWYGRPARYVTGYCDTCERYGY